jgi:predicted NUDIX family NTP pyrophosphohydrolase
MAGKQSAGILLYRQKGRATEVFLVHPGGPFWKKKDADAWTVPKGEINEQEDALAAAVREFREETGVVLKGKFIPLAPIVQKAGKKVYAWAVAGDMDAAAIHSNTFSIEWPPKSGKQAVFPEVDKAGWFEMGEARDKINPGQVGFLEQLEGLLA